jgi:hypothetical protein
MAEMTRKQKTPRLIAGFLNANEMSIDDQAFVFGAAAGVAVAVAS